MLWWGRLVICAILLVAPPAISQPIGAQDIQITDGDTIYANGKTYRLVGFDTPEIAKAKCEAERVLGERAAARLQALINQGDLDLTEVRCSCPEGTHGTRRCNYGRSCGKLTVKGVDVGQTLITEGLARPFICGKDRCPRRQPWC